MIAVVTWPRIAYSLTTFATQLFANNLSAEPSSFYEYEGKSRSKLFTLKWFYFNIGTKERPPSLVLRERKTGLGPAWWYRVFSNSNDHTTVPRILTYITSRTPSFKNQKKPTPPHIWGRGTLLSYSEGCGFVSWSEIGSSD